MAQPPNDGNIVKRTSQYLDNLEHDEVTGAKGVSIYGSPDGASVYRAVVNSDGSFSLTGGGAAKATDVYVYLAKSDDGTYTYYYFEDANLNYYVRRKAQATNVHTFTKGTGGYSSVYTDSIHGPTGSPTWGSYGTTF